MPAVLLPVSELIQRRTEQLVRCVKHELNVMKSFADRLFRNNPGINILFYNHVSDKVVGLASSLLVSG